jgi:hypothetical protein
VNCFAFIVAGLLARIASGEASLRDQAALGLALALGYLAKAPFLPIAVVCLGLAFVFGRKRTLVGVAVFLCVTGAYVAVLSQAKHRFTLGDSAKLNLAWHVDGVPKTNWQGGPDENGQPQHPTRQPSAHPEIFEFGEPVAGTYPPLYDRSYWNQGVRVSTTSRKSFARFQSRFAFYLSRSPSAVGIDFRADRAVDPLSRQDANAARLKTVWPVILVAAIPFVMYAPVHAEGRYLAPFFVLLWSAAFAVVLEESRVSLAIAATAALLMVMECPSGTAAILPGDPPARLHSQIARDLRSLGLKPGDRVAMVNGQPLGVPRRCTDRHPDVVHRRQLSDARSRMAERATGPDIADGRLRGLAGDRWCDESARLDTNCHTTRSPRERICVPDSPAQRVLMKYGRLPRSSCGIIKDSGSSLLQLQGSFLIR